MCGISGIILKKGESQKTELLDAMALSMRNRGPDHQGIWAHNHVGLSHARLRVIDCTEVADQPFLNTRGDLALVFNGEIYNFQDLRRELCQAGHVFRTQSDTEVILQAYECWGVNSFSRFNGMFAFAIVDLRQEPIRAYLVRDSFGIKPLFYSWKDGRLAFASELKPLMQIPWISRTLDASAILGFLNFSHIPNPKSIFSDVYQLEPGYFIKLEDGHFEKLRYLEPLDFLSAALPSVKNTPRIEKAKYRSENSLLSELESILHRVMERQVIADVPVTCFLSGGIDSTILALTLSELGLRKIEMFSIGYQEKRYDERGPASCVASHFQLHHHSIGVEAQDFFELIPKLSEYFDQPFADPTLLPSLLLSQRTRLRATVALSGDGGDEIFFGYPYQRFLKFLRYWNHVPLGLRQPVLNAVRSMIPSTEFRMLQQVAKAFEFLATKNDAELFQVFVGMIGPLRLSKIPELLLPEFLKTATNSRFLDPHLKLLADRDWITTIEQIFMRTFLPDTVLTKSDRTSMAYGLEVRVPFLDHELVHWALALPHSFKVRGSTQKWILRRYLEGKKVPAEITRRPKQGFSVPMAEWLRGPLRPLLEDTLNHESLKRRGVLNPEAITRLIREHVDNRANHSHLLWTLLMLEFWMRKYLT